MIIQPTNDGVEPNPLRLARKFPGLTLFCHLLTTGRLVLADGGKNQYIIQRDVFIWMAVFSATGGLCRVGVVRGRRGLWPQRGANIPRSEREQKNHAAQWLGRKPARRNARRFFPRPRREWQKR